MIMAFVFSFLVFEYNFFWKWVVVQNTMSCHNLFKLLFCSICAYNLSMLACINCYLHVYW
jgi:hypothetical protein